MIKKIIFLLPRKKNTGLNNVMLILARQLDSPVVYVNQEVGYDIWRMLELIISLRASKKNGVQVHSSGIFPDVLNRLSGKDYSSTTVHNYLAPDYIAQYGILKGLFAFLMHILALRGIQQIVACSKSVANNLRISHGISSLVCLNGCSDSEVMKLFSENQRFYYFAGPLISRKCVDAAAAAIKIYDPKGIFHVFGDGPEKCRIEAVMEGEIQRLIVAAVDCPASYYIQGNFYISFSAFEGMPLAVLEALKQGLIPILSDISPHNEIIDLLGISQLKTFSSAADGVLWACSLSNGVRIALSKEISRNAHAVFSEVAFSERFKKCLQIF